MSSRNQVPTAVTSRTAPAPGPAVAFVYPDLRTSGAAAKLAGSASQSKTASTGAAIVRSKRISTMGSPARRTGVFNHARHRLGRRRMCRPDAAAGDLVADGLHCKHSHRRGAGTPLRSVRIGRHGPAGVLWQFPGTTVSLGVSRVAHRRIGILVHGADRAVPVTLFGRVLAGVTCTAAQFWIVEVVQSCVLRLCGILPHVYQCLVR